MNKIFLSSILVIILLSSVFTTNSVNAKSYKDTLTIQTIWVTGNNSCNHNDVQRMNEYDKEIIQKYLSLYGLDFYYYTPTCMTQWEYDSYQSPEYTDLLIVIYNKNVGRDVLHAKNIGGFFEWSNMENKNALKIETCECPSFEYGDPIWVLSHELAHFTLYYLGYDRDIFEGYVHSVQSRYYSYCPDGDTRDSRCDGLWQKIEGYSRDYKVMKVFPGATSATPPQAKFVNYLSNQNNSVENTEKFNTFQTTKAFDYKKETSKLQKNTDQKINSLKSGISSAEKSLKSTNYKKSEAKEEVKKAWTAIWWAKKYLGDAENTQKEGKNFISKSDFKSAYYKYKYSFDSAKKIEPYLFEITKYLNNAKKLEK